MIQRKNFTINSFQDIFNKYKIKENVLTEKQKNNLKKNGYLVLKPTKFIKKNLRELRSQIDKLILKEGHSGGWEGKEEFHKKGKFFEPGTNRLGNLIEKNKIFAGLIDMPEILMCAKEVIEDDIKVCGLNYREPTLGEGEQKIHMDWKPRKNKEHLNTRKVNKMGRAGAGTKLNEPSNEGFPSTSISDLSLPKNMIWTF